MSLTLCESKLREMLDLDNFRPHIPYDSGSPFAFSKSRKKILKIHPDIPIYKLHNEDCEQYTTHNGMDHLTLYHLILDYRNRQRKRQLAGKPISHFFKLSQQVA